MVVTTPVSALKGSRQKTFIFAGGTVASGATVYVCGSATAATGPILGFAGKIVRVQASGLSGTTGTWTANAYILPTAVDDKTPGSTYLAMSAAVVDAARSASGETVGTATAGAAVAATDRLAVNIVGGTLGASITVPFVTVTFESDI